LVENIPQVSTVVKTALQEFDSSLPNLSKMRNVGEHLDDYMLGIGRLHAVQRTQLQVSSWNGTAFTWLGVELDIDTALEAAGLLLRAVAESVRQYSGGVDA